VTQFLAHPSAGNLAVLVARLWLGGMMFAHGYRHLKSIRTGPGMANWFTSLGLRNGPLQAMNVTYTELLFGAMVVLGLLTPLAYGACASIVFVAVVTNHWRNGFFINNPGEGYEYVATIGVLSTVFAMLGPGNWSLDHVLGLGFPFEPWLSLVVALAAGVGGTAVFLGIFWRPNAQRQG